MVKGQLRRNTENVQVICAGLASGLSLRKVCEGLECAESSVRQWAREDPVFASQYATARSEGYETLADQLVDISDSVEGDPARDRLRVDTRKWMLSKMLPKVYGDKIDVTSNGETIGKALVGIDVERDI